MNTEMEQPNTPIDEQSFRYEVSDLFKKLDVQDIRDKVLLHASYGINSFYFIHVDKDLGVTEISRMNSDVTQQDSEHGMRYMHEGKLLEEWQVLDFSCAGTNVDKIVAEELERLGRIHTYFRLNLSDRGVDKTFFKKVMTETKGAITEKYVVGSKVNHLAMKLLAETLSGTNSFYYLHADKDMGVTDITRFSSEVTRDEYDNAVRYKYNDQYLEEWQVLDLSCAGQDATAVLAKGLEKLGKIHMYLLGARA